VLLSASAAIVSRKIGRFLIFIIPSKPHSLKAALATTIGACLKQGRNKS
jgi:hypothetical protein